MFKAQINNFHNPLGVPVFFTLAIAGTVPRKYAEKSIDRILSGDRSSKKIPQIKLKTTKDV
jgi:hypothetical protein